MICAFVIYIVFLFYYLVICMDKFKKISLISLLFVSVVALLAFSGSVFAANDPSRSVIFVMRFRGIVLGSDGDRHSNIIGAVGFRAFLVNDTVHMRVVKGVSRVDGNTFNVTMGVGVIKNIHKVNGRLIGLFLMKGTAVSDEGVEYSYRLIGRAFLSPNRKLSYIVFSGWSSDGENNCMLFLEGLMKPRSVVSPIESAET